MGPDREPWEGDGPCEDCGGKNVRWHAPFEIWDSVMDTEPGVSTGGVRCVLCFVRRAWDKGLTDVNWELVPIPKGFGAKMPLEGRVVPRYHYFKGEPRELMRQWYASFIGTDGCWKEWDTAQAQWREARDSALLAGVTPRRNRVARLLVLRLNARPRNTIRIPVIHRMILFGARPVVLRHLGPLSRLVNRTVHLSDSRRSGTQT